jgi:2-hydroxycyclohexanecarboxyl-CoA dehydrogenase
MTGRLEGKVAIVTGGARGIGRATGELFRSEGAAVLLVDVSTEAPLATADRVGSPASTIDFYRADIRDLDQVKRAVAYGIEKFGQLDVLVNNAAVRNVGPIEESDPESWRELMAVNLLGAVNCCKVSLPALRDSRHGSIVNVSSVYGITARKNWGIYDASKAALISLTRTLACEEAEHGIRVNAVCLGGTVTPFTVDNARARGKDEHDLLHERRDDNLLRRWARPIEIAYPILWLASNEASFVTGTALMVDGGRSIV